MLLVNKIESRVNICNSGLGAEHPAFDYCRDRDVRRGALGALFDAKCGNWLFQMESRCNGVKYTIYVWAKTSAECLTVIHSSVDPELADYGGGCSVVRVDDAKFTPEQLKAVMDHKIVIVKGQ